jgi:SAM-dependent methyltransferase
MSSTPGIVENVPENDLTHWERVAQSRWGSYISEIEQRAILNAHSRCQAPSEAIEIGCEGGRWSKLLTNAGWKMTCVDINSETLGLCQRRLPTAKCVLVEQSASIIPCDTGTMGLMLCIEVSPVMPDSQWFIDEARRVLRPGGIIVGSFYNLLSYRGLIAHVTAPFRGVPDYFRFFYPAWRRELRTHGFTFLHEEGLCWFPFRRASNSVLIPALTAAEEFLGLRKVASLSPWIVFVAQKGGAGVTKK